MSEKATIEEVIDLAKKHDVARLRVGDVEVELRPARPAPASKLPESLKPSCPGGCPHPLYDHNANGCTHGCPPQHCVPKPTKEG